MEYKSKLHEWLRNTHHNEHRRIAHEAGVKLHYLQRLSRGKVPDPGLYTAKRIVAEIAKHNVAHRTAENNLPLVTLDDL